MARNRRRPGRTHTCCGQQGAGTAGDDTAAQLDAHLLDAGGFALLNGNSVPAAGAVAQQLHLHQSYMGVFGSADAGQAGGNTVLGIAAHNLHDGQAAALGGVNGQVGQRVGVGGVQRVFKHDRGRQLCRKRPDD